MGGKYKGKHVAANVGRPAADSVDDMRDDTRVEKETIGRKERRIQGFRRSTQKLREAGQD